MEKQVILKYAKLLVIARKNSDLKKLKRRGFQRITYFKTVHDAYSFFLKQPEKLGEYHGILERYSGRSRAHKFYPLLWNYIPSNCVRIDIHEVTKRIKKQWVKENEGILNGEKVNAITYDAIFEKLEDGSISKSFSLQKEDIKILWFVEELDEKLEKVAQCLGLAVDFKIEGEVLDLQNYDIVITNGILLERCKNTSLLLSVHYQILLDQVDSDIGEKICIQSFFENQVFTKEYRMAGHDSIKRVESILCSIVYLYKDVLERQDIASLKVMNLKKTEEYDLEYIACEKIKLEEKRKALEPFTEFDSLVNLVTSYLENQLYQYHEYDKNGIVIRKLEDTYEIQSLYEGRIRGVLFLPESSLGNLKTFWIQLANEKKLGNKLEVGIYGSEFEGKENIPPRMNANQFAMYQNIRKKTERIIKKSFDDAIVLQRVRKEK